MVKANMFCSLITFRICSVALSGFGDVALKITRRCISAQKIFTLFLSPLSVRNVRVNKVPLFSIVFLFFK